MSEVRNAVKLGEPMVSLAEAAEFFHMSEGTLRRYARKGRIRSSTLGVKLIRVRISEVEDDLKKIRRVGRPRKSRAS